MNNSGVRVLPPPALSSSLWPDIVTRTSAVREIGGVIIATIVCIFVICDLKW